MPVTSSFTLRLPLAFAGGIAIGILGGLIGLGGAEFRLPLLIGLFGFAALPAVILNKAMSLVVVGSALLFRIKVVPIDVLLAHWSVVANLLAGSLVGAWYGAELATRMRGQLLYRVLALLLVFIAAVLLVGHSHIAGGPNNTINTDSRQQRAFVALLSAAGYGGRYASRR